MLRRDVVVGGDLRAPAVGVAEERGLRGAWMDGAIEALPLELGARGVHGVGHRRVMRAVPSHVGRRRASQRGTTCVDHEEPLPQVLKREVMDPIGASDTWEWHGYETSWVDVNGEQVQSVSGGGHWGGGMFINTRDHARFGHLFLNEGRWGAQQLISKEWVDEMRVPSIEPTYGFMWWLNTDRGRFPSAPESSFFAIGAASTSTIWIDPEHDIVMVSRWLDAPDVDALIARVLEAVE